MTMLADFQLRFQAERGMIEPFDPDSIQPASIDLCLGNEFIVFEADELLNIDMAAIPKGLGKKVVIKELEELHSGVMRIHERLGTTPRQHFVLHPGEFCLGVTLERVSIPPYLVAKIEGRSSLGRLGLIVHATAGFVDPGFNGHLTLEMTNLLRVPIILRPGMSICQLAVQRMDAKPERPYAGRYQNAKGVEPSRYGQEGSE